MVVFTLIQIYCKNWFSDRAFYVTIADPDVGSLKSLHTLFDKYLDHMLVKFEQNRLFQIIQNFELFDQKWLTIFDKVLMPFWKIFCDWNNYLMLNFRVFHKFFGGGYLLFGTIFSPRRGQSQMGGALTSGTESDEGDLEKLSTEAKNAPYSKIRANFGVLSMKYP